MIPVIFQDEWLVAVGKPSGVLSVPGIGPENQDCVAVRVAEDFPGARIVHRLDRDTSGVMVLALDAETHRELSRQFQQRIVEKKYIAVVAGTVNEDEGEIDLPMRKDMTRKARHLIDHEQGRKAVTRWRVIGRETDCTRIELTPLTGRSHQLRLHMQSIGHPILGDDIYAPPQVMAMATRLLLHSESLGISHPQTHRRMTIELPCPF